MVDLMGINSIILDNVSTIFIITLYPLFIYRRGTIKSIVMTCCFDFGGIDGLCESKWLLVPKFRFLKDSTAFNIVTDCVTLLFPIV